ncbi:Ubiquitin-conjugating enzyme E2 32 [Rhynchospora pubera]|uniref:Ubiquitin-conjugating enzyme E2 32 n=1 Tax=Rhynchospora pubera TaxID=906938 RepID=A0AAV8HI47_9POAL|nr:Ubiquitin-conjugating enzyme E2 32 [Rhynchospora pubera]KAJ4817139.1 Ubiquitin-conjugating enzyme E2 32 [Rhynchospora pubera]
MASAAARYNRNNPAVKRILQEVKEMQSNPSDDFMSLPLEEDIFEWQFAILGPRGSEFEGGIYHGRIQLPADYPFKPPSFMMLTPSGRFETQTKICLSISNYHPEHWQPSWSVRTALVALIAFMPTNPGGALGSLDYKKEDRHALAIKSRDNPPKFGSPERQRLIDEIHQCMLAKAPPVPPLTTISNSEATTPQLSAPPATDQNQNEETVNRNADNEVELDHGQAQQNLIPEPDRGVVENVHEVRVGAAAGRLRVGFRAEVTVTRHQPVVQKPRDDRLYTWAAVGLTVAIVVLLMKKILKSSGLGGYMEMF